MYTYSQNGVVSKDDTSKKSHTSYNVNALLDTLLIVAGVVIVTIFVLFASNLINMAARAMTHIFGG